MNDYNKSKEELVRELEALRRENQQLKQSTTEPEAEPAPNGPSPNEPSPSPPSEKTILVVDDNDNTRELVADMMDELGYETIEAATAGDAVAIFSKDPDRIDLVISDIVMPEEDGPEMIEHILAIRKDIKVIFMSGYTEDEIVHDSVYRIQDTCAAFIKKPFSLEEIKSLIRDQIDP